MGRRIDVELTSARGDGTWTWRAAGAKQPKGTVPADVLYEGAQVGDVVRADAEFELDGIVITAVHAPRDRSAEPSNRLELNPPSRGPDVVTTLAGGGRRRERPARDQPPAREGSRARAASAPGPASERARPPRAGSGDPGRRPERSRRPERPRRPDRPPAARAAPASPAAPPTPSKPRRLAPGNAHRAAALASLAPEEHPIAEQVLRGGIPAVRHAVAAQNARLREEGQPEVHVEPLVAMAEQLLPRLRAAEWRDRAEAAAKAVDDVALRDLRSVVAGADLARDDDSRLLARSLRDALARRVEEHRVRWLDEIGSALDDGRLIRALKASARPPDAVARFPAELAGRLAQAAGQALAPDAPAERWCAVLEAVVDSPVRRSVKPAGLPGEAGEDVLHRARQAAGQVPALAPLLGIAMPPPPGPPRPAGPPGARRPSPAPGAPDRPAAEVH